ncbi:MAG: hypothetical protein ACR2J8_08640 [Thermomicrobiales bacterium]
MDGTAFDGLARALGKRSGRRRAMLAVAGIAGAIAATPAAPVGADVPLVCNRIGERCRRPTQCCSLTCENERCAGSDIGEVCISADGCSIGYCYITANYRGYCRCITRNRRCSDSKQCCSGTCSMIGRCGCSKIGQACEMSMHCCGTDICLDGWCVAGPVQ